MSGHRFDREGKRIIEEFGGIHGLRDIGLLEAAIFRPQNGHYDDQLQEAAALMESLANSHAFLDGNKKICLAATDTYLRIHGHYSEPEPQAAYKFILGSTAKREFWIGLIRDWLRAHARPVKEA